MTKKRVTLNEEQVQKLIDGFQTMVEELQAKIDDAIKYIKGEGISFLNIAGQRTWCGKHSADYILKILERETTYDIRNIKRGNEK